MEVDRVQIVAFRVLKLLGVKSRLTENYLLVNRDSMVAFINKDEQSCYDEIIDFLKCSFPDYIVMWGGTRTDDEYGVEFIER